MGLVGGGIDDESTGCTHYGRWGGRRDSRAGLRRAEDQVGNREITSRRFGRSHHRLRDDNWKNLTSGTDQCSRGRGRQAPPKVNCSRSRDCRAMISRQYNKTASHGYALMRPKVS